MENERWLKLLRRTPEDVQYITNLYDADSDKTRQEKLDAIDQWMKSENHLAEANKHMPRQYLQNLYLLSKCSTEATKQKIDKLLTLKTLMPELFHDRSIEEFETYSKFVSHVVMPTPCPSDRSRIVVVKVTEGSKGQLNVLTFFRYAYLLTEYLLCYDFTLHARIVFDMTHINPLSLIPYLNPIMIKKGDLVAITIGFKIKGIHIISSSPYVDKLVALLKQTVRTKVASRFHVHPTYEDLHKHIPKEVIPSDFGGDEMSIDDIAAQWRRELQTAHSTQLLDQCSKIVSDESKRSNYVFNEEYMGMPGSFRKFSVD